MQIHYMVSGSYEEYWNEDKYIVTSTELGASYLKINNLVRFKYPIGQFYLFFNGGISNGFSLGEINYKKKKSKFYSTETIDEDLALTEIRKYEQGYVLGTGVTYNRFSIEIRYEKGTGMSGFVDLKAPTQRYFCLIGYSF